RVASEVNVVPDPASGADGDADPEAVARADPGLASGPGGVDVGEFPEDVPVADLNSAALGGADLGLRVEDVVAAEDDGSLDHDVRSQAAPGGNPDAGPDDAVGADLDVLGDAGARVDDGRRVGLHSMSSSGSAGGADAAAAGLRRTSRRRPMWPVSA